MLHSIQMPMKVPRCFVTSTTSAHLTLCCENTTVSEGLQSVKHQHLTIT